MAENKFSKYKQGGNKFAKYAQPVEQQTTPPQQGGDKVAPYGLNGVITGQQEQPESQSWNPFSNMSMNDIISVKKTTPGEAFKKLDDTVRMFGNGVTFGFGDKMGAAASSLTGQGDYQSVLANNRAQTQGSRENSGATGMLAEIGGSMLPVSKLTQMGVTATKIPGMIGKYLGMGLDGAGYGALNAAGNDQDIATGAGAGALGGASGQLIGAGANKTAQMLQNLIKGKPKVPSLDDLYAAKEKAYGAIDDAGEAYSPDQVKTLAGGIEDDLSASGIDQVLNPMPYRFSELIKAKSGNSLSLRELDKIDSKIGRKLLTSTDGEDRYLGGLMRDNISEFMDANGGSQLIDAARGANRQYRNLERVLEQTTKAERRAASTGSGGNEDNAIRQNIRAILDNKKTSKFYNQEEKAAMDKVVSGTTAQNVARRVGKMSPENGGLMAAMTTMGSMLNPYVGIPAATGFVSKRIADKATKKNIDELIHLLSTGKQKPVAKGLSPQNRELLSRLIMGGAIANAPK